MHVSNPKTCRDVLCVGAFCALLLLALVFFAPSAHASAVYEVQVGESVYATCASDGVLRVAGLGETYDFAPDDGHFADFYTRGVKAIVVESGVSTIGDYLFYGLDSLKSAPSIAPTVKSIGEYAFANCGAFGDILFLPAALTHIGEGAFSGTAVYAVDNQYVPKQKTDATGALSSPAEYTAQHIGKNAFDVVPDNTALFTAHKNNSAFIRFMKRSGFTYIPAPGTIQEKGFSTPVLTALSKQIDTSLSELNLVFVRALDLSSLGYTTFPAEEIALLPGLRSLNFTNNALLDIDPAWVTRFGEEAFAGNILPSARYANQYRLALKQDAAKLDFSLLAMSSEEIAALVELRRGGQTREVLEDGLSLRFVSEEAQSRIELYAQAQPLNAASVTVDYVFALNITYQVQLAGGALSYSYTPGVEELEIDSKAPLLSFRALDIQSEALSELKDGIQAAQRVFVEWNTAPDASGVSYASGQDVTLSGVQLESLYDPASKTYTLTLYAHCVPSTNILYVDGSQDISNTDTPADGSAQHPYSSFREAYAHLAKSAPSASVWENYILVLGETELSGLGTTPATITSNFSSSANAAVTMGPFAQAEANAATRFISLDFIGENAVFYANGHPVTFGAGLNMQEGFTLYGGAQDKNVESTSLTVTGGNYAAVFGGGKNAGVGSAKAKGDITLFFGEGAHTQTLFGASENSEDHADIALTASGWAKSVYGGGYAGKTFGNTSLSLSGGGVNTVYGGGLHAELMGNTELTLYKNAVVADTIYGGGGGEEGEASKAGTVSGSATINIYGEAITVYGGGEKASAQVLGGTRVNINPGGSAKNVFGGGKYSPVSGEYPQRINGTQYTCVTMVHGSAENVYGGGGARVEGGTYVNLTGNAHSVYGSGTGLVDFTSVRIAGSVSGNIYGAGGEAGTSEREGMPAVSLRLLESAQVGGSVYGASSSVNGQVLLVSAANIQGSVYGGSSAGDILQKTPSQLAVSLQIRGGKVKGSVYGGSKAGIVNGSVEIQIHSGAAVEGNVCGASGKGVLGYASLTLRRCTVGGLVKGGASLGSGVTFSGFSGTLDAIEHLSTVQIHDSSLAFDAAKTPRSVISNVQQLAFAASGGDLGNSSITFGQNQSVSNLAEIIVLDSRGSNTLALTSGTLILDNSADMIDNFTRVNGKLGITVGDKFAPTEGIYVVGSRQSTGGFTLGDDNAPLSHTDHEEHRIWHVGVGGQSSIAPRRLYDDSFNKARADSVTIADNGAFTVEFEAGYYPEGSSAHAFVFSSALPAGTKLVLVDKSAQAPQYYALTLARASKILRFSQFSALDGSGTFADPTPEKGEFTREIYRLVVDFSGVAASSAPKSGTITLRIGSNTLRAHTAAQTASSAYAIAERTAFSLAQSITPGADGTFTITATPSMAPSAGADPFYEQSQYALVFSLYRGRHALTASPLPLPRSASLLEGEERYVTSEGVIIVPLTQLGKTRTLTLDLGALGLPPGQYWLKAQLAASALSTHPIGGPYEKSVMTGFKVQE